MYYYVKTKVKWVLKWSLICYYQLLIAVTVLQRVQQIASIKRLYFFFNLLFSCTQCVNRACHLRDRLFSSCTKQRRGGKIAATKDYLFSSAIQKGLFYCKTLRGYRMNCCFCRLNQQRITRSLSLSFQTSTSSTWLPWGSAAPFLAVWSPCWSTRTASATSSSRTMPPSSIPFQPRRSTPASPTTSTNWTSTTPWKPSRSVDFICPGFAAGHAWQTSSYLQATFPYCLT